MTKDRRGEDRRGPRRLVAGLRITRQEEALLAAVRPAIGDDGSAGELAHRLWRRGLELALAEAVGLGAPAPAGLSAEAIATMAARQLALALPLLRQTGRLALLGLAAPAAAAPASVPSAAEPVDIADDAAQAIAALGADEFL